MRCTFEKLTYSDMMIDWIGIIIAPTMPTSARRLPRNSVFARANPAQVAIASMNTMAIAQIMAEFRISLPTGTLAKSADQLFSDGYINADALTATNVQSAFLKGKAAIIIKGNWDTSQFTQSLGANVGVFIPPYSNKPMKSTVEFAGNGFAMTSYSPHKQAAAEFLQFITSKEAGQIMAKAGLIPAVSGVPVTNSLAKAMVGLVNSAHYTVYPMLDNVTAPGVVNAGNSVFPDMLTGGTSVSQAASSIEQAWHQLAPSERGHSWATYSVPA